MIKLQTAIKMVKRKLKRQDVGQSKARKESNKLSVIADNKKNVSPPPPECLFCYTNDDITTFACGKCSADVKLCKACMNKTKYVGKASDGVNMFRVKCPICRKYSRVDIEYFLGNDFKRIGSGQVIPFKGKDNVEIITFLDEDGTYYVGQVCSRIRNATDMSKRPVCTIFTIDGNEDGFADVSTQNQRSNNYVDLTAPIEFRTANMTPMQIQQIIDNFFQQDGDQIRIATVRTDDTTNRNVVDLSDSTSLSSSDDDDT